MRDVRDDWEDLSDDYPEYRGPYRRSLRSLMRRCSDPERMDDSADLELAERGAEDVESAP
mgnify:CR=1 FL=1